MSTQPPQFESYLADARTNVVKVIARRRLHFRVGIVAAVAVGAVAITGGAVVVQQVSRQQASNSVQCFAHDDLNSLSGMAAQADQIAPSPNATQSDSQEPANKAEMCALVWRAGLAEAAANGGHWLDVDPNTSTLPVPALAYCTLANGITGGFPIESPSTSSAQVCSRLGLAEDLVAGR
ncbi:MAG: hypothetical protein ABIP33_10920 [Pseudolysinimonas sp.]